MPRHDGRSALEPLASTTNKVERLCGSHCGDAPNTGEALLPAIACIERGCPAVSRSPATVSVWIINSSRAASPGALHDDRVDCAVTRQIRPFEGRETSYRHLSDSQGVTRWQTRSRSCSAVQPRTQCIRPLTPLSSVGQCSYLAPTTALKFRVCPDCRDLSNVGMLIEARSKCCLEPALSFRARDVSSYSACEHRKWGSEPEHVLDSRGWHMN